MIKAKLNNKYSELCAQLGDLSFRRHQLDVEISALTSKIKMLNDLQPELIETLGDLNDNRTSPNGIGLRDNQSGSLEHVNETNNSDSV
jgi:hypothetical protein